MNTSSCHTTTDDLLSHYFGPISELLKKEGVNNIYVNRYDEIQYEAFGETHTWERCWDNEHHLRDAVKTLANALHQPIHGDEPLLDAVMPDGSRLNAGLPPVVEHTYMAIRVFPEKVISPDQLIAWESLTRPMYDFLKLAVLTRQNIVVSGGTGSGKTTLVQMLLDEIPDDRRLVVIEDTKELKTRNYNCLQLEAPKRRSIDGRQLVTLGRLVINALRQTPKALVVGEMRESDAAVAYRTLLNTGHSGVITTLHADSAEDSIDRLRDLVQEGMPSTPNTVIENGLYKSLNLIVHAEDTYLSGKRTVAIAEVQEGNVVRLFEWDYSQKNHRINKDALMRSEVWHVAQRYRLNLDWMDDELKPFNKNS